MLVYLASPYAHDNPLVRQARMKQFYEQDARLSALGLFVVSPLYKVETAKFGCVPDTWEFWKTYSYELLSKCGKMMVIKSHGWDLSTGVHAEIEFCEDHNIPIEYIDVTSTSIADTKFQHLAIGMTVRSEETNNYGCIVGLRVKQDGVGFQDPDNYMVAMNWQGKDLSWNAEHRHNLLDKVILIG